jgi:hypothetical protein
MGKRTFHGARSGRGLKRQRSQVFCLGNSGEVDGGAPAPALSLSQLRCGAKHSWDQGEMSWKGRKKRREWSVADPHGDACTVKMLRKQGLQQNYFFI